MLKKKNEGILRKQEEQVVIWQAVFEEMAVINATERCCANAGEPDEYTKKRMNATFCCPKCFGFLKISDKRCPVCGLIYGVTIKEIIRDTAFEFATFAWNYRRRYEEDMKNTNGKITTKHHLFPPQDWLIYLASIVLVAIIGGVSYDLFKLGFVKIAKRFSRRFKRAVPEDEWLEQLYSYLNQYFINKRTPGSLIMRLYLESKFREAELNARLPYISEYSRRLTKEVRKQSKSTDKIKIEYSDKGISQKEFQKELHAIKSQLIRNERALIKLKEKLDQLN